MTAYSAITSNKRRSLFLIALFVVLIIVIGWVIDRLGNGGTLITPVAGIIALVSALGGYFAGDKIALAANGAVAVGKQDAPELYRIVENLSITAGLPMPKLYVIPSAAINAFATGRDPQHASVAVTRGLVERLDRSEIEAVLAHEFSHIRNYDIRLMTVTAIFVGTVALTADLFLRSRFWGFRSRDDRAGNISALLAIAGIILILLSPLIAKLIQLAISRRREHLADASGVLLTRYPQGLISALQKIQATKQPVKTANSATAHLYFANPLTGRTFSKFFATHPPIEERIAALQKMA